MQEHDREVYPKAKLPVLMRGEVARSCSLKRLTPKRKVGMCIPRDLVGVSCCLRQMKLVLAQPQAPWAPMLCQKGKG